jgi:ribosomal protein S6
MTTQDNIEKDERLEVYEIGFHIVPIVSVDALPAEVNAIRSLIESNGGVIISEGKPTSVSLAYDLSRMRSGKREKFDNAFFGWIKFEVSSEAIGIIKQGIEKNENILRHLIIKTVRENTLAQIKAPIKNSTADVLVGSSDDLTKAVESSKIGPEVTVVTGTDVAERSQAEKSQSSDVSTKEDQKMTQAEMDKQIDDMVKE